MVLLVLDELLAVRLALVGRVGAREVVDGAHLCEVHRHEEDEAVEPREAGVRPAGAGGAPCPLWTAVKRDVGD